MLSEDNEILGGAFEDRFWEPVSSAECPASILQSLPHTYHKPYTRFVQACRTAPYLCWPITSAFSQCLLSLDTISLL
ncbi:hypothetical protein MPER_01222 [Moniliophthora perniciosa FA553]|nr:hypothetical protein MPER_01222 [Moniliophthora perniciosa FA553]